MASPASGRLCEGVFGLARYIRLSELATVAGLSRMHFAAQFLAGRLDFVPVST